MNLLHRPTRMKVRTVAPSTGDYTVEDRAELTGSLISIGVGQAMTVQDRAEMAARRRFLWDDPAYQIPEDAQLEDLDTGYRWNPDPPTFRTHWNPMAGTTGRAVDVVRVR